jgi:LCP family protein required for cell wall assembly
MTAALGGRDRKRRGRHTGWQWLVLTLNCIVVLACLAGAVGLLVGKSAAEQSNRVVLPVLTDPSTTTAAPTHATAVNATGVSGATIAAPAAATPPADASTAENFLVVGVDNNACIDPNSKYAGGIGQRSARLTDTIMMIRVDLATKQAVVLSFPRDLWVRVGDSMRKINSAYRKDDPSALVTTIYNEFQIRVDHFISVDFCAFMTLVDAVGGITVPLSHGIRDTGIGLDVPDAGCHRFAGDEALAYVRSRYLEYKDTSGQWRKDGTSDFGRIARQQDFLRRTLTAARGHLLSASVIRSLYDTYSHYLVIDDQLTPGKILELADVLRQVDSAGIRSYQFDVTGKKVSEQDVLFVKPTANMTAILDVFRGKTSLTDSGNQVVETVPPTAPSATTPAGTTPPSATTTAGAVEPQPNAPRGAIVPDSTAQC